MNYKNFFFVFLLLSASCRKEEGPSNPEPTPDPIPQFSMSSTKFKTASKFLKREISYIRTNPLMKNVRIFLYDDAMRCTEIRIGTIDSSQSNPAFIPKQTLTFNYDGSASLLPASVSSVRTVFPDLTTTYYYAYNSQGRKVKDSVRVKNMSGEPADKVINYVYDNDKVYATPTMKGFSMENSSLDTLSLLTAGNIEKLVSRFIHSAGDQVVTYSFTYDQGVSPYNKMNIANSLYFESAALGLGYNVPLETHYMGVTTNNITSWTSGTYTAYFNYLYDGDKYPVRKEMILPGDSNPYQVTFFEY